VGRLGLSTFHVVGKFELFGYPESYTIPTKENDAFDLLGNTVAVPVVKVIAERVAENCIKSNYLTKSLSPVCSA